MLCDALARHAGRIALVSSFGAESAVLLHMVAGIDRATPVIFLDTGKLFAETLAYRDHLVALARAARPPQRATGRRPHRRARSRRHAVARRSRSLLLAAQGRAARRGARGLRCLDHRPQAPPGGDAPRSSDDRAGGGRADQDQSARRLGRGADRRLFRRARRCRAIRCRRRAISRSAAPPARARCAPARIRAPGAGPAPARSNAASISAGAEQHGQAVRQ